MLEKQGRLRPAPRHVFDRAGNAASRSEVRIAQRQAEFRLRRNVEAQNKSLATTVESLTIKEEEIARQNEELQSQTEELERRERTLETLLALGVDRGLVVHGSGLDEIAPHAETKALRIAAGALEEFAAECGAVDADDVTARCEHPLPHVGVAELGSHDELVAALAFSPDGKLLASGACYIDPVIRLWDLETAREVGRLEGAPDWESLEAGLKTLLREIAS